MVDREAALAVIDAPVVSSESVASEGLTYADLTDAQKEFVDRFVEWFQDGRSHFGVLKGYAGAGKSACLKVALGVLGYPRESEEGDPLIWAAAPTHQAVGVMEGFLGNSVAGVSTLQSLLGLKPEIAKFSVKEAAALAQLQAQPILSEEDELRIELLQKKEQAALEQALSLQPSRPKPFLGSIRLLLVDECGMVAEQLFTLLHELIWEGELVSPSLQVLFVGDPAQLPPVGESESLTFTRCNILAELTEVVRYSGSLLEYATALRDPTQDPERLHRLWDDDALFTIPGNMAVREGAELIQSGDETVRFICGTNARCRELNYQLRVRIQGESHLAYAPGDELITTSAIQRGVQSLWVRDSEMFRGSGWEPTGQRSSKQGTSQLAVPYGTGRCRKGVPVLGTSTYVVLGENISDRPRINVIDDYLTQKHGAVVRNSQALDSRCFELETLTGAKFTRQLWGYSLSDGGAIDGEEYLWLLDPNQVDAYLSELAVLKAIAGTTKTRSTKGKRGQEGDTAKQAWELLGLKNWDKWADGTPVTADQFKDLQSYLWAEFHALDCFVDPVTWSYAITCHRAQGVTIDIAVIDLHSIVGPAKNSAKFAAAGGALWDVRKSLYTAATRARLQVGVIE